MGEDNTLAVKEAGKQQNIRKIRGRPFPPGVSGNPKGRPLKGHSITETIRAMMDEKPEIKKALGTKILGMALEGDITAIKTIWGYLDGLPIATVNSNIEGGLSIDDEGISTELKEAIYEVFRAKLGRKRPSIHRKSVKK